MLYYILYRFQPSRAITISKHKAPASTMKPRKLLPLLVLLTTTLIPSLHAATLLNNSPSWSSPTGLQYSEEVYAQVYEFSGSLVTNTNSKLATFNGTNCAGVIGLSPGPNGALFQLPVYSDTTPTNMTYQVYDGGLDLVQPISQGLTFTSGGILGSIVSPIHLSAVPESSTHVLILVSLASLAGGLLLRNRFKRS